MQDSTPRIHVHVGDITDLPPELGVDGIVNAANESLLGGGGVDGAIHRAAGRELLAHNRTLGGCPTGLAKRTPPFQLASAGIRHILHTVGPVWSGDGGTIGTREDEKLGDRHEDVLLASCYHECLKLAAEHGIEHLAFPAISTGVYGFPRQRAARIAFGHVHGFLLRHEKPAHVTFVCFSDEDAAIYHEVIATRDTWMFSRKRSG